MSGSMADFECIPAIGNSYLHDDEEEEEEEEEEKEVGSGEDDDGELEGDVPL